jgi:error-prone DNA polymerase
MMVGFYTPDVIVNDAKRHGIDTLPPHVNYSQAQCTLEGLSTIRLGLAYVQGLGVSSIRRILEARNESIFRSLADFCRRTGLARGLVENLIKARAMEGWGTQRELIWALGRIRYNEKLDLVWPEEDISLPPPSEAELLGWEREALGLNTDQHVMELYRETLQARGVCSSRQARVRRDGETVTTAGLVIVRQRPPTATGPVRTIHRQDADGPPDIYPHNCYLFITLEDEEGLVDLILSPVVAWQSRIQLRTALLVAKGRLQSANGVVNLIVREVSPLLDWLREP